MSGVPSLDEVRRRILASQQKGLALPDRPREQILVSPEGRIVLGDDVRPGEERQLSQVHQGVFAQSTRSMRDASVVATKLPSNTRMMVVDGVAGWRYSFVNSSGERYDMFLYHDGSLYQVLVAFPEVAGKYNPHYGHLYSDGRICFGSTGGLTDIEQAYAKSVVWSEGFSVFRYTEQWPFNFV